MNKYAPTYQHHRMNIPANPTMGNKSTLGRQEEVIGMMTNGVVLDVHAPTWSYDECGGHSDTKHQYHYHLPPTCFLKAMGYPVPESADWWIDGDKVRDYKDMAAQWPTESKNKGNPAVIGFALDGFPIYGPYDSSGKLVRSKAYGGDLDDCNGKKNSQGEYGYYLTAEPPFVPTCLMGSKKGTFTSYASDKECPKEGIKSTVIAAGAPAPAPTAPAPAPTDAAPAPTAPAPAPTSAAGGGTESSADMVSTVAVALAGAMAAAAQF